MPPTDYIATPGGSLKLKGAPTKITKHKKHKRPQQQQQQQRRLDEPPPRKDSSPNAPTDASAEAVLAQPIERKGSDGEEPPRDSAQQQQQQPEAEEQRGEAVPSTAYGAGRTQAERRHDERRRKRVSFFPFFVVLLSA
ncbi:hypothetical protein MMC15_002344 [Xylographa vitiligo]|nr:hypothetical protein [Xylographa vitiligo]